MIPGIFLGDTSFAMHRISTTARKVTTHPLMNDTITNNPTLLLFSKMNFILSTTFLRSVEDMMLQTRFELHCKPMSPCFVESVDGID